MRWRWRELEKLGCRELELELEVNHVGDEKTVLDPEMLPVLEYKMFLQYELMVMEHQLATVYERMLQTGRWLSRSIARYVPRWVGSGQYRARRVD